MTASSAEGDEGIGTLPLADIKVIDLTLARSGPTCVRQLSDWGAKVVRIEPPAGVESTGIAGADFQNLHRGKGSIVIDLKSGRGHDLFCELVADADVLIENMRPKVKHRLNVDYDTLSELNPRLVYGSISGFGQDGPYADRGGVDQIAQGLGGLMSITGHPGQGPMRVGVPISDLAAGIYLATGVLVALHERERSGRGQWVQTSLIEAMIGMLDFQAVRWTVNGDIPAQAGNHHPTATPMGCFATSDGWINLAGSNGRLWEGLCAALGLPELVADPRFDSAAKRSAAREELNEIVGAQLALRTTAEWVESLSAVGVPAGPVNTIDEVFNDPQVRHLKVLQAVPSAELGEMSLVRNPVRMSRTPCQIRAAAPVRGADTDAVLAGLGYSATEIAELRRAGVVQSSHGPDVG